MSLKQLPIAILSFAGLLTVFAGAQQSAPISDVTPTLDALEQTARNGVSDISHLRVEKWKADNTSKRNAQSDSDSIQRNMSSALPELIGKVRSAPQDLNANFRLYRNLNVLYEYFVRFTETAGAFGSRDDFDTLTHDLQGLENARRAMADRLDSLSSSAQSELAGYRAQVRAAQAAAAAPPAKKIVIDDSDTDKKPAKKKKPAAKPAAPGQDATPPADSGSTSGTATPKR